MVGVLGKSSLRALLVLVVVLGLVMSSGFSTMAQGVALGYVSNDPGLKPGMVVQLSNLSESESSVERATQDQQDKIIGVATNPDEPSIVITSESQRVYVQTDGEAFAFVSDINGTVSKGDRLTISPLRGILMKLEDTAGNVNFGTALEDFPATATTTYQIESGSSDISSTEVAKIKVNLDAGSFAIGGQQEEKTDSALAQLGKSLTGRDIGEVRVFIALLIFLVMLVAEGGIIYGAVSSSITAIGRNPLAKKIIKSELVRVLLIAILVLLIGLSAIYGVLWV